MNYYSNELKVDKKELSNYYYPSHFSPQKDRGTTKSNKVTNGKIKSTQTCAE